jgi:hypothetical protein
VAVVARRSASSKRLADSGAVVAAAVALYGCVRRARSLADQLGQAERRLDLGRCVNQFRVTSGSSSSLPLRRSP